MDVIRKLGEEVYEKYYSNLASMIAYLFNQITWTYDEIGFDGTFDYFKQLKPIVTFCMDIIVR
jgi:hypothetical protein